MAWRRLSVVVPGAEEAVRKTRRGRIGIIGTAATIRSQAYVKAIHALKPDAQVFVQSCPLLVPLVEEGWLRHAITVAAAIGYPVMLKATSGGGGRGIRRCNDAQALRRNYDRVLSEATKAFGSADVFLENFRPDALEAKGITLLYVVSGGGSTIVRGTVTVTMAGGTIDIGTATGSGNSRSDNQPLALSLSRRRPYIDPINHIQVRMLKRYRSGGVAEVEQDSWLTPLKRSINAIAAGMRNTG